MRFEDLEAGQRIRGVLAGQEATVVACTWHGENAIEMVYRDSRGVLGQVVLYRDQHEAGLALADDVGRPFDAHGSDFRLAAEAQRIQLAGGFDPMFAVTTSAVEPLPHQIRAVYDELLPRMPLRFLLADDPGAGKTIMAGLYLKELLLREDAQRVLIVAPGGLVEQWQDELAEKFSLHFTILTNDLIEAERDGAVFDAHPLLIARMDQLARNDELRAAIDRSSWDVVVVDEAHRMAAHYFGGKLTKTKRYQLGEQLSRRTRHFLLMTATPHAGSDEDFQLFLALLDRDRFSGRYRRGVHSASTQGVMRRMVKEDLLTFDGKPLFPERIAETVPYELTDAEEELYEQVTNYVRMEMNRAARLDDSRRNTVGFALTVLQRRLASSPEAIYRSLLRRAGRLEQHRDTLLAGEQLVWSGPSEWDEDEHSAAENEQIEEELIDAATSARTVAELEAELGVLRELTQVARRVRLSGTDRKWSELRTILEDHTLTRQDGQRRKLIIFTEHRDTLNYLAERIGALLGRPEAVVAIHGGVRRALRRQITEEFTHNPECQILLATDAAGEGLNLQAAHLMVNYDLPWNPNRIEQRFGRIHRIGQTEVCRLWNLVATNTREGQVFTRLLAKIEEQRAAYGGKVFDVLGEAFTDTPLRTLLIEAIRYGDQPHVRSRADKVIDESVAEGLSELLQERALADEALGDEQLQALRRRMEEARARRLQPYYIELAFRAAFSRLGGRISKRESSRFEITNVPASLRQRDAGPIATRYERVTFDPAGIEPAEGSRVTAELLAPGHPLHDAVFAEVLDRWGDTLDRGAVLVSAQVDRPYLLLGVQEEVHDGAGQVVSRRFGYAQVEASGVVRDGGPAPYLDAVAASEDPEVETARQWTWLAEAERHGVSWILADQVPRFLAEVREQRLPELHRVRAAVTQRLSREIDRLATESMAAMEKQLRGERVRESPDVLDRRSQELQVRLERRLAELDRQELLAAHPAQVVAAAIVLPVGGVGDDVVPAPHARDTSGVDQRAVAAVLAAERSLGRVPVEQEHNNAGFDVLSTRPDGTRVWIEVKGRLVGKNDFFISRTQVLYGLNLGIDYRLAAVRVDPRGPEFDQVRYRDRPFGQMDLGDDFDVEGITANWDKNWAKAREPF